MNRNRAEKFAGLLKAQGINVKVREVAVVRQGQKYSNKGLSAQSDGSINRPVYMRWADLPKAWQEAILREMKNRRTVFTHARAPR